MRQEAKGFPIQVQLCLFRKVVLLPYVSENIARFLYTSGTGETSKQGMPMSTENESTQDGDWVPGSESERIWKSQVPHNYLFKIFLAATLTSKCHHSVP